MGIEVKHVTKHIRGVTILDDVSLSVSNGAIAAIAGPNGSGKTMLMRLIAGLITPDEGSVVVDGATIGIDRAFPESMGILIESPQFLSAYTGRMNLCLLASIRDKVGGEAIDKVLEEVGLRKDDKRPFRKYSLGMKQRLGLAAAVMESPSVLLLDEPSNALDRDGVRMLRRLILKERERGAAVLWACHDRELMESLSDEVYYLAEGHIDGHEIFAGRGLS